MVEGEAETVSAAAITLVKQDDVLARLSMEIERLQNELKKREG